MLQILLLLAFIIPAILFFLAQQNILKVIGQENREMSPRSVWLQLIPLFGLVWQFIVVIRISSSVLKELASRVGESILDNSEVQLKGTDEYPTYTIGIAYCILTTIGFIINYATRNSISLLRLFGTLFFLAGMVCWIIYWVRIVKTKNKLAGLS